MKRKLKNLLIIATSFFLLFFISLIIYFHHSTKDQIYNEVLALADKQAVIVLGARVYNNGVISHVLKDRLDTALELYKAKKIEKILLSGDHGQIEYDEVNTMKAYIISKGADEKDVFTDHAGFDTYDSIYRAKHIFAIKSATIVTQKFHLPRALFIANSLDLEAVGLVADRRKYLGMLKFKLREYLAQVKAFLETSIDAKPKFLGDAIPITGDSSKSWD